jgi:hypothetical protein
MSPNSPGGHDAPHTFAASRQEVVHDCGYTNQDGRALRVHTARVLFTGFALLWHWSPLQRLPPLQNHIMGFFTVVDICS